uniref:DksA C4-type domain-containing protein n=1 Tax=Pseudomonas phage Nican01 TaxID=3138540 RepID=A0AAU6W1G9_9CAUD
MRKSRQPGFDKMLEAKRENAKNIMSQFTQNCDSCNAVSSKVKLFDLEEGRFCLNCLPEGMTGLEALDIHTERQAMLKEQRENPVRPDDFGGWS